MIIEITENQNTILNEIIDSLLNPNEKTTIYRISKKLAKDSNNLKRTIKNIKERL